jgi:tryptophan-rich sensory protein
MTATRHRCSARHSSRASEHPTSGFRNTGDELTARPSLSSQTIGLLGWLALAFAAGAVGAFASLDAASFYGQLSKPSWAPPASIFGPVWSALYALMGIAAWLVWRSPGPKRAALALFCVQLAANALWSWLFFAWRSGPAAAVEVLALLALIVATVGAFWHRSRLAALLLLPYALWVGFASVLTWVLWRGNPGLL